MLSFSSITPELLSSGRAACKRNVETAEQCRLSLVVMLNLLGCSDKVELEVHIKLTRFLSSVIYDQDKYESRAGCSH